MTRVDRLKHAELVLERLAEKAARGARMDRNDSEVMASALADVLRIRGGVAHG